MGRTLANDGPEPEIEHLLDSLDPAEELRAAVPGSRSAPNEARPVLIGVTNRRMLVIGRRPAVAGNSGTIVQTPPTVDHVTLLVRTFARDVPMEVAGGTIELDLDADALDRLCRHLARLDGATGAS
jgi:hypothetical protein